MREVLSHRGSALDLQTLQIRRKAADHEVGNALGHGQDG